MKEFTLKEMTEHHQIYRFFPFVAWLKGYDRTKLRRDLGAGITVAVVLIPRPWPMPCLPDCHPSMALCRGGGSSTCFDVGELAAAFHRPIAILSLLVLTTLSPLAEPGPRVTSNLHSSRLHGRSSVPGDRNFSTGRSDVLYISLNGQRFHFCRSTHHLFHSNSRPSRHQGARA